MNIFRWTLSWAVLLLSTGCQSSAPQESEAQPLTEEAEAPVEASLPPLAPESDVQYLEIVTPDPEAMRDFCEVVYGWEFAEAAPELGNALTADLPNGSVFGIRGPMRATETPIVRTYLLVEDIDEVLQRAEDLGAQIAWGPAEMPGGGRLAIYIYGGIGHGVWQNP